MSQFPISFVFTGKTFYDCWINNHSWFCICSFVDLVFAFFFITNFYVWISLFFFNKKLQKLIYSSADGLDAFASFGKLPNDPFKTYNNTYIILINAGSCNEVTVVQYTSLLAYTYIWIFDIFLNSIQYKVWWSVSRLILWKISTGNSDPNKFLPPSHCAQKMKNRSRFVT